MKILKQIPLLIFVILFLAGCGGGWVKPDKQTLTDPGNSFSIQIPNNWQRFTGGEYASRIMISYDGPGLQRIEAYRLEHDKAFEKIKKSSTESMLPSELAELALAEMKADEDLKNIEVIENRPATIGGKSGFCLHTREKNEKGLRIDRVTYAFADKKGYYVLVYEAPKLNYFDKSATEFENVVKSFKEI